MLLRAVTTQSSKVTGASLASPGVTSDYTSYTSVSSELMSKFGDILIAMGFLF